MHAHVDASLVSRIEGRDSASVFGHRVSVAELHRVWARRVAVNPNAAIELAETTRLDELGIFGFAVLTADSLGAALETATQLFPLINASGSFSMTRGATLTRVEWHSESAGPGAQASVESILAHFIAGARELGRDSVPVAVHLQRPSSTRSLADLCRRPASIGSRVDALDFANRELTQRNRLANPRMHEYFIEQCRKHIAELRPTVLDQVRVAIEGRLAQRDFEADAVARELGMSRRTLHRRLREHGTTFREVLEAARRRLARSLVCQSDRPVTEIAFELGFGDTSSFSRAFRRWFSLSPSQARAGGVIVGA